MRIALLIALILPFAIVGQRVRTSWTEDTIQIGGQTVLTVTLENTKSKPQPVPIGAEIPCQVRTDSSGLTQKGSLELLATLSDTFYRRNASFVWMAKYRITAWDTGTYILPPLSLALPDTTIAIQPPDLKVLFEKKAVADGLDEVFVPIDEDPWWWLKKYWWLGFIPLAAIAILLVRKKLEVKKIRQISLKERSLLTLKALQKQEYWLKDRIDDHYTEFSFLLRSFLSARYSLNLMERTSAEAMELISKQNIGRNALDRIEELLALSDEVKFAQHTPDHADTERALGRFEELIIELSPLEIVE
jgi:hypothetical protein